MDNMFMHVIEAKDSSSLAIWVYCNWKIIEVLDCEVYGHWTEQFFNNSATQPTDD